MKTAFINFYTSFILIFSIINANALSGQEEERALNIFKDTRCLVCEGQNIYESNSEMAKDLKNLIYEMIHDGKSNREIKLFLSSKFGDWILMTPPINKLTYFLWFSPIILILCGVVFFYRRIQK